MLTVATTFSASIIAGYILSLAVGAVGTVIEAREAADRVAKKRLLEAQRAWAENQDIELRAMYNTIAVYNAVASQRRTPRAYRV